MKTILLVDDQKTIRVIMEKFLVSIGYKVICAANGKVGLELFESEKVDLVVTDIVMPEVSGIEFIHRIKQIDENVPILVMPFNFSFSVKIKWRTFFFVI